ncbi:Protein SGT1 A [Chytriomyces hyalinus]|nr:Protein SGT1 A [Chytriomyces hyalinus]
MSDPYTRATAAFMDEDYDLALTLFTQSISDYATKGRRSGGPTLAEMHLKRSITYAKLQRHADALADAETAVTVAGGDAATRAKALFRRGVALANLGKQQEAKESFSAAKSGGCADKLLDVWIAKVGGIDGVTPAQLPSKFQEQATISETPALAPATESTAAPIPPAAAFLPPAKIRHEWFQNENFVTVAIFIKSLPKDDPNVVKIEYATKALSVTIKLPSGSDYMLELDPLFEAIVPSDCKHSVMSTKVEIKLKKSVVGIRWADLEATNNSLPVSTMASAPAAAPPAYPSSSKKKTDWDNLIKNQEEEKPEGEAALQALFKTIYKDASEDTRRAMMKSYQESGGTVLSTNWAEIGKETVKVSPPEGMIAKKFEI